MRKFLSISVVIAAAILAAGCSSGSDVRSNSGPTTTVKTASSAKETTTSAVSTAPKDSPSLFIQGSVTVPAGEPGKLSVVFTAVPSGSMGAIPVIVRNNTEKALDAIQITGTARAADGSLVGSGNSQGIEPDVLKPGEWGFGWIAFGGEDLPAGSTIETTATGDFASEGKIFDVLQLKVNEINRVPGDYSSTYVGIVANPSSEQSVDNGSIYIGCFDEASNLVDTFSGYTDGEVVPGGTASFSIDAPSDQPCAAIAVGASGFTS